MLLSPEVRDKAIVYDLVREIACRPLSEEEFANLLSAVNTGRLLAQYHPDWLSAVLGAWQTVPAYEALTLALLGTFVADHPVEGVNE